MLCQGKHTLCAHTRTYSPISKHSDPWRPSAVCAQVCLLCAQLRDRWNKCSSLSGVYVFFCCKSKFIHSVLSSLHHLSHVISEPLFQHFQHHWKSGATFVAALWFYFVSGTPLPCLVHLRFSVTFSFLLIPSCSNIVLLRHVGGALITLWTHIFYTCFGVYLSVCLSDAPNKHIIHLWCALLTDCHVISFFLVSVIGSGSGSDSLLSTGPSRKWRNKNDLIIEDRRCNLTSGSANLLSWLCSDFRAQRPFAKILQGGILCQSYVS